MIDYTDYYVNQAGNGLPSFSGPRYQKGYGFLSNIFSRWGVPLLKYLGKSALKTTADIGSDILEGKNIRDAARGRLVTTGRSMANDAVARARKYVQTGTGKRRKRRRGPKKTSNKKRRGKAKKGKKQSKPKRKSVKRRRSKKEHFNDIFSS
jgi:hypothetical protein